MTLDRRTLLACALLAGLPTRSLAWAHGDRDTADEIAGSLRSLEGGSGGRLGTHVLDTASGREFGHRSDERFLMLSTFKTLASAFVLHRVDTGAESLDRRIRFEKKDLVAWSPVTQQHADGPGMTLSELCAATITTSDNTAANLILASFGGPPALTAYLRSLGDTVTRLDRIEPELNAGRADELLDTTSPRAMARTLQKLTLGTALTKQSRGQLVAWLDANTTGERRLKAGLPEGWKIAEKTGTNDTAAHDVGILWPPHAAPIVVSVYLAESTASIEVREATLAAVGRLVAMQHG